VQGAREGGSHAARVALKVLKDDYLSVVVEGAQRMSRVLGADIDPRRAR
jgi:hypothetical protein